MSVEERGVKGKGRVRRGVVAPHRISPSNALMWGVAWLIVAAIVGWYYRLMPVTILGYDIVAYKPLWQHVAINAAIWVVATLPLYVVSLLCRRDTPLVELFGRMLYAHWPSTLLLLPALFDHRLDYALYMNDIASAFEREMAYSVVVTLLIAIVTVWYLWWGYKVFSSLVQRTGGRVVAAYGVGMILSAVAGYLLICGLY